MNQGLPTISAVPMSSLQSPSSQNTAVIMPRQNQRGIDLASIDDRSGMYMSSIFTPYESIICIAYRNSLL